MKYAIIGVEGPQDQAFVGKVLRVLGFQDFSTKSKGLDSNLDPFWRKLIPKYPQNGDLYKRLFMPSILFTEEQSVVIYAGEGSKLSSNLGDILANNLEYQQQLSAFGIVADCDRNSPEIITSEYAQDFRKYFPHFPHQPGRVELNLPRTGVYILPNNASPGVLDTLLCHCGEIAYPDYIHKAKTFLAGIPETEQKQLEWKPFDRDKALVAAVVSILKPGKGNTPSIADNNWINATTQQQVPALGQFVDFLKNLLDLS